MHAGPGLRRGLYASFLSAPGGSLFDETGALSVASVTSSQGDHGAEKAVDGNRRTYWASAFDPPKDAPVQLDLKLGEPTRVTGVKIDWEYPAQNFEVQVGKGGKWATFYATGDNPLLESNLYGSAVLGDSLRILMKQPHPVWAAVGGHALYGIRGITVS
mmetsp:Transcript_40462/g.91330  ORF Transcript_40462/g.91330 Transcript_40462/m.91330 type:complete len:159 (-) Transcript_40462:47-523(-)|eukprot:CAMPEP_0197923074 /NCGR_PEP_ID=MMETSP1439-20131203/93365_1 /TAXON_ID=66791 /ORGANISM="Gonyaulax spinifera, Strain CCMP409" /LENGTH=158 /DNA_ID=CAMNT_0043545419 /DNA_START=80 /DNA_END=556 /DNA_ORIENTATION=-